MVSLSIFAVLPFAVYALLVLIFFSPRTVEALLNAVAKSHLIFFALIAVSTEILSAFHSIDFPHVRWTWCIICACVAVFALFVISARARQFHESTSEDFCLWSPQSFVVILILSFILLVTVITAVVYPPNNWDSMAYHMARVAQWINHGDVSFYPTNIERQNFSGPLAEYAILQLQILVGTDRFANLVQWISFVVCIAEGALIAAELSSNVRARILTAVVMATIPMSILQASSTQNDLVLSSFVLAFALFMLRLRREFNVSNVLFASLSLGLALLTKGSGYIYCAATGLVLALAILFQTRSSFRLMAKRAGVLAVVCLVGLLLNVGHYIRCHRLYGMPVYDAGPRTLNEDLSIPAIVSNIPKNIALHLGTRSRRMNATTTQLLDKLVGKQIENRANDYMAIPFALNPYSRHEDYAGNPIHALLALAALGVAVAAARRSTSEQNWYLLGVLLAGLLFCFALKWQPWASRLHTPLFMLSAPIVAIALTRANKYVGALVVIAMVVFSLPFLLRNQGRPLISREWLEKDRAQLYFMFKPRLYAPYQEAMNTLVKANAHDVGLFLGPDDWEYPLWVMAKEKHANMRFRHVGVREPSKVLQTNAALPPWVLATAMMDNWEDRQNYEPVYQSNGVTLLQKREPSGL